MSLHIQVPDHDRDGISVQSVHPGPLRPPTCALTASEHTLQLRSYGVAVALRILINADTSGNSGSNPGMTFNAVRGCALGLFSCFFRLVYQLIGSVRP